MSHDLLSPLSELDWQPGRVCPVSSSVLLPPPLPAHGAEIQFLDSYSFQTSLNWNQSSLEMSDSVATNFIVSGVLTHQCDGPGRRIKMFDSPHKTHTVPPSGSRVFSQDSDWTQSPISLSSSCPASHTAGSSSWQSHSNVELGNDFHIDQAELQLVIMV